MLSPAVFNPRPRMTCLFVFFCALYLVFCWSVYTVTVEPLYGVAKPPYIEADSGVYFARAGLSDPNSPGDIDQGGLVGLGGSALGPVLIALAGRTVFGVACINCLLFFLVVWWAGFIPGVRREVFALLMMIEPQLLPTLMTLNKEILAISGLVAFAAYRFAGPSGGSTRGPKILLLIGLALSTLARWEQILILLWYLFIESKWSPLRGKRGRAMVVLLFLLSAGWALCVHVLHLNFQGFIVQIQGGGLIVRLYSLEENGLYFLAALPKILMNIAGRWVTPIYFLHDYWMEEFTGDLQNEVIGVLSSLTMLLVLGYTIVKGRFRLAHPLVYLGVIYFVCLAVLPFIQHRYVYPAYSLFALELARRKEFVEAVSPLPAPPALPPSYTRQRDGLGPALKS